MLDFNPRHLFAIAEVARTGSANRAAERVYLSQPAITQAIKKVEQQLGTELFVRQARGMQPSDAGKPFIRRVDRALGLLAGFDRATSDENRARNVSRLVTRAQLQALVTVAEHRSYTVAAARLRLSQPTVHRSIRELQQLLGVQLFYRSARGVDPTAEARHLARLSRLAAREIEQGIDELAEHRGAMQGRLAIGCLPMARTDLLPESVTRLIRSYPDARIGIVDGPYDEQLHGLLHGDLDLILGAVRDPLPTDEVVQETLFEDPLAVVVRPGHPALAWTNPQIADLRGLEWIAPRPGTPTRDLFGSLFGDLGLPEPQALIECSSLIAIRGMLLRSDRASLLSVRQVRPEIESGLLRSLPLELAGCTRPIGITTRRGWHPTRLQSHFLDLVRSLAATGGEPT